MNRRRLLVPGLPSIPGATPGAAIHEAFVVNGSIAQRVVIGQVGALVSLILGSGVALALLLDGRFELDDVGGIVLVLMALGASVGLRRGSVPLPIMDMVTVVTEVALAGAGIQGGPAIRIVLPAIYISIGTSVCLIRPMTGTLLHMAAFIVSYGAVVLWGPPLAAPLTHWLAVVAAIVASGTLVRWLVSGVVDHATAEHDARLEIEETTAELAAQDESRTVFLAKMSHELRTPLNAVVGFADLMQDEVDGHLDDLQRELVEDIAGSGRDLLALVDDLLDVRKVGEGEIALRLDEVDLCEVARTVERLLWDRAQEAGVRLRVRCATKQLHLRADPLRVRQILWNVVGNAIKYSPAGEVVDLDVFGRDGWATATVTDRGPGIDPDERDRIFELYQQGAAAAPGSGIGLSLCRGLSEAHDGTLVASAGEDGGSTFILRLPVSGPAAVRGGETEEVAAAPSLSELDQAMLIPGSLANRQAVARVGGHFARAVAALLPMFAVITPGPVGMRIAIGGLGFVSLLVARAIGSIASRGGGGFSSGMMDAWAISGLVMIAVCVAIVGPIQDVVAFSFGWPVLTAGALASPRRLFVHSSAALVCYAVALAFAGQPDVPQHWLAVAMIVLTNAIVVSWVAARLRESIVGLYEARLVAESAQRDVATVAAHKRDFLASTSHELLTPLNAVLGASGFLRDGGAGPLTPQQLQHLDDIHESGDALLTLLSDMLDFAKLEDGRIPHLPSETEVVALVERALDAVRPLAEARHIALAAHVDDGLATVVVDPENLLRAVGILLVNGLKFTAAGGRVDLIARRTDDRLLLSVRDTGVGIGAGQLASVFDPFHQGVRTPPNGWEGGSGLGLALARGLLDLEGGSLCVESTPDVGSTFTISIAAVGPEGGGGGVR